MDILYYSNNCVHSQKLLQYLAKNGLTNKLNFLSIDRRTRDPANGQVYLVLDRGTKVMLPPNVHNVPSLVLLSQNCQVLVGNDIYQHLTPRIQGMVADATGNNGEPAGFLLSGGGAIVSEKYTSYSMTPEELSSKGRGGGRQMHNYVTANHDAFTIPTPPDNYKADKIGEVDMESLQQRRNSDVSSQKNLMGIVPDNSQQSPVYAPRGPANSYGAPQQPDGGRTQEIPYQQMAPQQMQAPPQMQAPSQQQMQYNPQMQMQMQQPPQFAYPSSIPAMSGQHGFSGGGPNGGQNGSHNGSHNPASYLVNI